MAHGSGTIYQRGDIWHIGYMVRGKQVRESSHSRDRKDAVKLLQKRMGEVEQNRAVGSRTLTVPTLLEMLEADYVEKEMRSIADLKGKIAILKKRLKGIRAAEFGTQDIQRLKSSMKREGAADATINRYLACLRRAFKLAERHEPPLVGRVPHFELFREDNTREGFITTPQYRVILEWLPEHLRGMLIFGYHLGMRKEALKGLRRDLVDWDAKIIRTAAPKRGKSQGKELPIYGEMIPWLEAEMALWNETPACRWILHQDGKRIGDFRKSWATACKAARVPWLLFHDLRRSAARNMIDAGIPEHQAMAITGHKTPSMFRRYAIVNRNDIRGAGEKLERLMEAGRAMTEDRKN